MVINNQIDHDWLAHISSAMTAGMISTTLTSPVWVIKTRFMVFMDFSIEWPCFANIHEYLDANNKITTPI